GDAVLKSVAEALSNSCLGSDDLIARYGGEEFAVILPGTTSDSLATIAARILRNVTYLSIAHEKSQCSKTLTVSIGMVCLDWSETEPEYMRGETKLSATSFLEKADAALYWAKNAGRNCAKF
ncbi:GGDEF domain-containing protein, partial [Alteromonas mediterranea]